MASSSDFEVKIKGRVIKVTQTGNKKGRRRALHLLTGNVESPRSTSVDCPTHFIYKIDKKKEDQ